LREHGIDVTVAGDPLARDLIEAFSVTTRSDRPFVALKMAMSLDGRIASRAGVREQIGSPAEARYVRDLRTTYDAVMVGAGTIRVDDPQLTVRPPHDRLRPYVRVIACGGDAVPARSRVFEALPGYDRTIALVPGGSSHRFDELRAVADVIEVGASDAQTLDLRDAMARLRAHGIFSVLCEGGPKLGASLLAASLVDRVYWAIAARLFGGDAAVPVLSGADLGSVRLRIDRVDRVDSDVVVSAAVASDV
jgi:diaminohydroxyphosphoribosylaminopyrimidine deaminase / 5-amino-6-(5-phosphoribosylamino)uracil reductase